MPEAPGLKDTPLPIVNPRCALSARRLHAVYRALRAAHPPSNLARSVAMPPEGILAGGGARTTTPPLESEPLTKPGWAGKGPCAIETILGNQANPDCMVPLGSETRVFCAHDPPPLRASPPEESHTGGSVATAPSPAHPHPVVMHPRVEGRTKACTQHFVTFLEAKRSACASQNVSISLRLCDELRDHSIIIAATSPSPGM